MTSYAYAFFRSIFDTFNPKAYSELTFDPDVEQIAKAFGVKIRGIRLTYNRKIIAQTNLFTRVITVSKKWLDEWTQDEYNWVMAHEVFHIKRAGRFLLDVVIVTVPASIYMIGLDRIPITFTQITAIIVVLLLMQGRSRKNESASDGAAKKLLGPKAGFTVIEDFGRRWGFEEDSSSHPSNLKRLRDIAKDSSEKDDLPKY